MQGCANEGLNGIIYLFLFFEAVRAEGDGLVLPAVGAVLPLAGPGADLPVLTGAFLASTVLACEVAVGPFSAAKR